MDALSFAVPLTPPATPASSAGDNPLLTAAPPGTQPDFATLLAAGMATPTPDAETTASEAQDGKPASVLERETEHAEQPIPAEDSAAQFGVPAQLAVTAQPPIPLALPAQIVDTRNGADPEPHAEHARALDVVRKDAPAGAPVAAAGAPVAAAAANVAAQAPAKEDVDAAPSQVRHDGAAHAKAEPVEPMAVNAPHVPSFSEAQQAAHLQGIEQRPVAQPTAVREVPVPVGSTGFADAFSQQVVWMVDKDAQVAELRLNPPELGPVEVRLTLSGDEASAQFVSPHAEVRAAIESSIVRLRESMAEAGIQLGEASVSADSFRGDQATPQSDTRHARSGYAEQQDSGERVPHVLPNVTARRGLVDIFA